MPKRMNDAERRHFMLTGNLWYVILVIASPMILMNLMNLLYTLVDTTLVAGIGDLEVSAIAIANQIKNMALSFQHGLAIAATMILAKIIGQNDFIRARKTANMLIVFAGIAAVLMALVGIFFSEAILRLCNVSDTLVEIASDYLMIQLIAVGICIFNAVYFSFEKSRGATTNIFATNLVLISVKICLSIILMKIRQDVIMVAIATLIPNALFTVFVLFRLAQKNYTYKFVRKELAFPAVMVKEYFKNVWPILLSRLVFSSGKVVSNSIATNLGDTTVGAMSISNQIGAMTSTITEATEETVSVIIRQNLGNGNPQRGLQTFYRILIFNIAISLIGIFAYTLWMDAIVNIYAEGNPEFYQLIYTIFKYERWGVLGLGISSAVMGFLLGFGYTRVTFLLNLCRLFVLRIPSLYIVVNFTNLAAEGVGMSMLLSNMGVGVASLVLASIYLRKVKKEYGLNSRGDVGPVAVE